MTLTLSPEIAKLIAAHVRSGRYGKAEDVVAAAILSLEQQEALAGLNAAGLETMFPGMREKIALGLREARAGRLSDGEAFFDELEKHDRGD